MKCRVYKSLDKSSTLFGIRDVNIKFVAGGGLLSGVLGFGIIGPAVGSTIIGSIVTLSLAALSYLGVMAVQARFSDKELQMWRCARRTPDCIAVPPRRLEKYNSVDFRRKPAQKEQKP